MKHQSSGFVHDNWVTREKGKDEWLTPPAIIKSLGVFNLDPCSPVRRPWNTASNHYTIVDDGLTKPWDGRVWMNPPYGRDTGRWLRKLQEHGNGVALVFARTETKMFAEYIWNDADGLLFLHGRIAFHHVSGIRAGSAGAPSCLIAYGLNNVAALESSGLNGALIVREHKSSRLVCRGSQGSRGATQSDRRKVQ